MAGENRDGSIEIDFGDGAQRFRLGMGELEELQEKTGAGPYRVLQRLMSPDWTVADVRETIRLGLIGGGMKPIDALIFVRRYVDDRPDWIRNATMALAVISAALAGAPEEAPGKKKGAAGSRTRPRLKTAA